MEGMLDNLRNILLWITSESTSSESQNSLFVELHHTSIICLTSRSILFWKLCFQFCTIVTDTCINIGDRVELIPRPGQRLCADAAAASARATELIVYLLSPLPTPRTPQPGLASALYTITIGTTCISTGKKVLATKWLLA